MQGILGILVPNIPYVVFHIRDRFNMLSKILVWIPYRILGFVGLYPKNTASGSILRSNLVSLYNFWSESFIPYENVLVFVFLMALLIFAVKSWKKSRAWTTLVIVFLVSYIGLFIHGDPPKHYYLAIFPIPIIVFALFLDWLLARKNLKIFAYALVSIFLFANFKFFFSNEWFYRINDRVIQDELPVPYELQKEVVKTILKDAKRSDFTIRRVGPLDYFREDFSQNYRYLFWKMDNEPTADAQLVYTIYEDTRGLQEDMNSVIWVSNMAIKKQDL